MGAVSSIYSQLDFHAITDGGEGNRELHTKVVNIRNESYDIYIGRSGNGVTSIWGNPFSIGKDGTRSEVIQKYRDWLLTQPQLLAILPTLKGKRLGCFCKPKECHGDVLVELIENV